MDNSWLGLEGKSVVVTGGASGIGYAIAAEFPQITSLYYVINEKTHGRVDLF